MTDHYHKIFKDIDRILITTAHPDDMEILFGGTVARLVADGKQVRVLICTNGNKGGRYLYKDSAALAQARVQEQSAAALALGLSVEDVCILDFDDCSLDDKDPKLIERIVYQMRSFRPQIIFTHYFETVIENTFTEFLWLNHRDHRAVGLATMNAILPMARDLLFFPEHAKEGLEGISIDKFLVPDLVRGKALIAIHEFVDQKRQALLAHISQISEEFARDVIASFNVHEKRPELTPYYAERFRFYRLGYFEEREDFEELS